MAIKVRHTVFLKIESQLNTDPTPAAADDALELHDTPSFEMVTQAKSRPIPLGHFGESAPLIIGEAYKLSGLKIPFKASGTAGTAPRCGVPLRIAGFTQTISAGVSVTYTPHSSYDTETATAYFWDNGKRHKLLGCVASAFKIPLQAGELNYIEMDIIGIYGGAIEDVTFPSPTFESSALQVWQNANFKINPGTEYTPTVSKYEIDLGLETKKRQDPNGPYGISRYYISQRKTKYTFDPEQDTLANLNPYTLHQAQTEIAIETKPTYTAGHLIELTSAKVTLDAPKAGERDGIATWDLTGQYRPSMATGNTDLIIVFK